MRGTILKMAAACVICLVALPAAQAQSVWSGFDFSFTKPSFASPVDPENQDRITDEVWITRHSFGGGGIFNAQEEGGYSGASPLDTEWATDLNNLGETIAATNFAALEFDPWITAYGGQGSGELPARLTSRNAVMHLITDDIYLDLRFTSWTFGDGSGGGFSYERALPPDAPETTGDYNLDGFVNAADYVHWRKTFGDDVPEGTGADGVPDGTIDDNDYDFWVEHYGETVTLVGGGPPHAVPEPAAAVLIMMTSCALSRRVKRHGSLDKV